MREAGEAVPMAGMKSDRQGSKTRNPIAYYPTNAESLMNRGEILKSTEKEKKQNRKMGLLRDAI